MDAAGSEVDGIMELTELRGAKPLIFCLVAREAGLPSKARVMASRTLHTLHAGWEERGERG